MFRGKINFRIRNYFIPQDKKISAIYIRLSVFPFAFEFRSEIVHNSEGDNR